MVYAMMLVSTPYSKKGILKVKLHIISYLGVPLNGGSGLQWASSHCDLVGVRGVHVALLILPISCIKYIYSIYDILIGLKSIVPQILIALKFGHDLHKDSKNTQSDTKFLDYICNI